MNGDLGGMSLVVWVACFEVCGFGAKGRKGSEPLLIRFQDATEEEPKAYSLACDCQA